MAMITVNLVGAIFGPQLALCRQLLTALKLALSLVNVSLCTMVIPCRRFNAQRSRAGTLLKWIVVVDGLQNVAPTTSYDRPRSTSIKGMTNTSVDPKNLNPAGGVD